MNLLIRSWTTEMTGRLKIRGARLWISVCTIFIWKCVPKRRGYPSQPCDDETTAVRRQPPTESGTRMATGNRVIGGLVRISMTTPIMIVVSFIFAALMSTSNVHLANHPLVRDTSMHRPLLQAYPPPTVGFVRATRTTERSRYLVGSRVPGRDGPNACSHIYVR